MAAVNIWSDDWEADDDWSGGGAEERRLLRGDQLGATLYSWSRGTSSSFTSTMPRRSS
jgi:hypothetical protein